MGLILFGIFMLVLGLVIEATMGSFTHVTDWGWPRRAHPVAGVWVKIVLGRVGALIGVVCIGLGVVTLVL